MITHLFFFPFLFPFLFYYPTDCFREKKGGELILTPQIIVYKKSLITLEHILSVGAFFMVNVSHYQVCLPIAHLMSLDLELC